MALHANAIRKINHSVYCLDGSNKVALYHKANLENIKEIYSNFKLCFLKMILTLNLLIRIGLTSCKRVINDTITNNVLYKTIHFCNSLPCIKKDMKSINNLYNYNIAKRASLMKIGSLIAN